MGKEMLDGAMGENTLLLQKTLRSGQSIKHSGNVVVLGDVNPGAEIVAGGHVIIMGTARGVIHAGASGNESATITAFYLNPTQLRIGNFISRAPDGDRPCPENPETARIKDGMLIIEKYQSPR
ncbi:septum site-determining protein MinC [Candidatus Formimonas warabiya]|uniref:Septum site-determining protein MinC n=1 Tax=Formimonas warabiya TaxID=1761012 RepID=A0A3G1KSJ5_FORW1|nr:septum site-determining protein MinC [Candidatus Formimonas warabiya]ATW25493.1 septum site-determining protein MinC [Candidatus Formimonas warabiya]